MLWHILTPEYPPDCGGVGDYTALVAEALADAGDVVHVWHPGAPAPRSSRVTVHALPDRFARGSRAVLDRAFTQLPGAILVQYVPTAFGLRGANVPFARWLLGVRHASGDVRVMFHEPFFYFALERPWRNALAIAQRAMASLMVRAGRTVYFSTENWFSYLRPYGRVADAEVIPVPATIAIDPPASLVNGWTARLRNAAGPVIGHFGTYGDHVAAELAQVLPEIWRRRPSARVLLVGDGSVDFMKQMRGAAPCDTSVNATGRLSSDDVAAALRACDVLIAPYPDGVTTRRTSMMAALTTSRPVVTTDGPLTESVWRNGAAVPLVATGNAAAFADSVNRIAGDAALQLETGAAGRRLYDERFALRHTIAALRRADVAVAT